ncbi:MAG: hypothetical protein HC793_02225 [Aquincola sp.]|nr:hypothetical protein [Aquincola sp.]
MTGFVGDGDRDLIGRRYAVKRTTSVLSFTAPGHPLDAGGGIVTQAPGEVALDLFAAQDHARDWLERLLASGQAFACRVGPVEGPDAVCFAFANHGPVWEIGGVFTPPERRGRGHARGELAQFGESCGPR